MNKLILKHGKLVKMWMKYCLQLKGVGWIEWYLNNNSVYLCIEQKGSIELTGVLAEEVIERILLLKGDLK